MGPSSLARAQAPVERPLTLAEARAAALVGNADLAIAQAEQAMATAGAREAGAFVWPRASASAGVVHSADPVFAFGAKLRQGRFAEPDFAVDALNDPDPISDWATTLDLQWGVLDPTRWAGWSAARHRADAAAWGAARAREGAVLQAEVLYWGAVRASAARATAESAEEAARSTLDLFRLRQERGLLTEADRLRAEAELAGAEAARIEAERAEHEARRMLGVFLGWDPDVLAVPTDTLAPPPLAPGGPFDAAARADLRALAAVAEARSAERRQARLSFLPAVEAFGHVAAHADDALAADGDDWTVGAALRWTAFTGFARAARRDQADAALMIARTRYEQALRAAAAEVDVADQAVTAAAGAVEAAQAARRSAETAARLVRRRFEEGLATATDLLQAEARRSAMRGLAVDALAAWRIAVARAEFVRLSSDPEDLP
jgi:outer membrane protein TolC